MNAFDFTYNHKRYIIRNRFKKMMHELAAHIGCSTISLRRYMKEQGLLLTKKQRYKLMAKKNSQRTTATKAEDRFIKNNYLTMPVKTIASKLGRGYTFIKTRLRELGLKIPKRIIEQRKKASQFKKGRVSENKGKKQHEYITPDAIKRTKATRFKKGQLPHNTKYDGAISIRYHQSGNKMVPYQVIRLEKKVWKMLHVFNWEQENGPVPEGCIVVFKNKNTMDCDPSNLEMITLPENMLRNTIHRYPPEIKELIHLNAKLKRKTNELRNTLTEQEHS